MIPIDESRGELTATAFAAQHEISLYRRPEPLGTDRRWSATLARPYPACPLFRGHFEWPHAHAPQLPDILTHLATEADAVDTAIDQHEWARYAGIPDDQFLPGKYLIARAQARRLKEWLPPGAYETLVAEVTQK